MADIRDISFKTITHSIKDAAADLLSSSDFISRTIGMNNSYEDIMFIVKSLGREPISLLGKDYAFIYDHVRRNYLQGTYVDSKNYENCPKFTLYKEKPTVKFADPYNDPMNLLARWVPEFETQTTMGHGQTLHYSESNDEYTNNKEIGYNDDLEYGNPGVATPAIASYGPDLGSCDLIKKTNDNFNHGKYETLVARFHTNKQESKSQMNPTQTANSKEYGMSHGRNLLKITPTEHKGYDNPYCRVWTYFHQYNQIARQIRPFDDEQGNMLSQERLEEKELTGVGGKTVGFRTTPRSDFDGGSKRLDRHGVLNYQNGTVNIAPTAKISDYFYDKQSDYDKHIIETKKCMFSIENLAWRDNKSVKNEYDPNGLSPEQKGPLGGRIMWFPPYDLTFSEDVSVKWNTNEFIGRGESVYTYTNTERRGNLNFTLLIDHPSILDYWTGHYRNGGKNKGVTLAEGNSGGVDNVHNQENTLLRFFAGCDILTAVPQKYKTREIKPENVPEPPEPTDPTPTEPDEVKDPVRKTIVAILYYPNNYSGKDDINGVVNPIYYLMNGIGTQKYVDDKKDASDIPTTVDVKPASTTFGKSGYEVSYGIGGVSDVIDYLDPDFDTISGTYADVQTKERKAQYLTGNNGIKKTINYGGTDYTLAKIIGSEAMSLGNAKTESNLTGETHLWYRKRYYYRVDKAYENQDFSNPMSYIDAKSFGLNGQGYDIRETSDSGSGYEFMRYFGLKDDSDSYKLISFTDLFVGLEGDGTVIEPNSIDNVRLVRDVFSNKDKYSNIKISFNGHASYQGYGSSNNDLATNRALTIKRWLNGFNNLNGVEMGEPKIINQQQDVKTNVGHVDDRPVKIWRSASVVIEYEEKNVSDAATAESPKENVDRVEVDNKDTSVKMESKVSNMYRDVPPSMIGKTMASTIMKKEKGAMYSSPITSMEDLQKKTLEVQTPDVIKEGSVNRYDNEGEFFQALTKEAPFLHNLISDKIKYFDPAFHSISPEGFNARLTFLHQCTRQGSTVEDSMGQGTAYNLAFGRPPVCVLRLGDFYYTKIVITSLNIQYETAQWDMNPEGIGMMPMFAKITINFNFLGGSDLAGPIARLQNAVSFNYYANTSVYDDRAEMVEYDPNGSGREIKFKGYTYPSVPNEGHEEQKETKKKKKKGGLDKDEFLQWMSEFYNDTTVSNSAEKQTEENIINFDKNFK